MDWASQSGASLASWPGPEWARQAILDASTTNLKTAPPKRHLAAKVTWQTTRAGSEIPVAGLSSFLLSMVLQHHLLLWTLGCRPLQDPLLLADVSQLCGLPRLQPKASNSCPQRADKQQAKTTGN